MEQPSHILARNTIQTVVKISKPKCKVFAPNALERIFLDVIIHLHRIESCSAENLGGVPISSIQAGFIRSGCQMAIDKSQASGSSNDNTRRNRALIAHIPYQTRSDIRCANGGDGPG